MQKISAGNFYVIISPQTDILSWCRIFLLFSVPVTGSFPHSPHSDNTVSPDRSRSYRGRSCCVSSDSLQEVSGIELHTRKIRIYFHGNSGLLSFHLCNLAQCLIPSINDKVVIISLDQTHLMIVGCPALLRSLFLL